MNKDEKEIVGISNAVADSLETNLGNEGQIQYVALSCLRQSPLNVRRKAPTGIDGLADSILAKGLLQNLVIHQIKGGRGKNTLFGVCAGQRRLAALTVLAKAGKIANTYPVAVKIVSDAEALAASLIENHAREEMAPADLCQAFKLLVDEGRSADYIAALFGVSVLTVQRRLKLANVSPRLLDLYRDDGITTEQMHALALTDDHAMQERLWFDASQKWLREPHHLRSAITLEEVHVDRSPLVALVGLEAYEAAGGFVRRDLFSDEANSGYIGDMVLLQRLAAERLSVVSAELKEEGWAWVETRDKRDYSEMSRFACIPSHLRPMTDAEKIEFDRLRGAAEKAAAALDAYENEDDQEHDDDLYGKLDAAATDASEALDAYSERLEAWTDEEKAGAGVFVILYSHGELHIERGLIERVAREDGLTSSGKKLAPLHSEKLCRRLTAHRTAAVHAEIAAQPNVALAVLMHRMIPVVFPKKFGYVYGSRLVDVQVTCSREKLLKEADDMSESIAWRQIESERAKWSAMMPNDYADLMPWLLGAGEGITPNLFAFCIAATVDSVSGTDSPHSVNALMDVLDVDMSAYWQPTKASYLAHVSKARIGEVVTRAVSAEAAAPLAGMKKGEVVDAAEKLLAGVNWLPEVLANREHAKATAYGVATMDDNGDAGDGIEDESQEDAAMASVEAGEE